MRVVFVRGRRRGGNMERCRRADRTSLFTQSKTDAVLSRSVAGVTDLMVDAACAHSHQSDRECRPVLYPSIVHTSYISVRGVYMRAARQPKQAALILVCAAVSLVVS